MLNLGLTNIMIIPVSKDNVVFGLRAVGRDGKKNPTTYALVVASQYFG